jgi:arylsulfatase A-like enzyme
VIDGGARVIDVLPTIADALGFELPFETQGKSLLDGPTTNEVAVDNRFEQVIRMPVAEFARQQRAIVARNLALFGSETGWAPVYSGYQIKQ